MSLLGIWYVLLYVNIQHCKSAILKHISWLHSYRENAVWSQVWNCLLCKWEFTGLTQQISGREE